MIMVIIMIMIHCLLLLLSCEFIMLFGVSIVQCFIDAYI